MPQRKVVGVMFGGRSGEHAVSLVSAASVIRAIDRHRYTVVPIGIRRDGSLANVAQMWKMLALTAGEKKELGLAPEGSRPVVEFRSGQGKPLISLSSRRYSKLDAVFPVLHGPFGEDGIVQGLMELTGVPYVGSGVTGSAAGMDKEVMKRLFRDAGLPIVPFMVFSASQWEKGSGQCMDRVEERFQSPYFVKPVNLGSSVGVSKSADRASLRRHIDWALQFDTRVIVEQGLSVREVECAVLGNDEPEVSVAGEICSRQDFYDYDAKYKDDTLELVIPAALSEHQAGTLRDYARRSFEVVQASGLARVDFFLEKGTGQIYVNEINTIPGFTSVSMYPKLWEASGVTYPDLIDRLIHLGIARWRQRARLRMS
ncbi:MAG: D-alanine--D-alanine ligase family protein [Acidobacteriota bacterium]